MSRRLGTVFRLPYVYTDLLICVLSHICICKQRHVLYIGSCWQCFCSRPLVGLRDVSFKTKARDVSVGFLSSSQQVGMMKSRCWQGSDASPHDESSTCHICATDCHWIIIHIVDDMNPMDVKLWYYSLFY